MSGQESSYELPKQIERCLASLSKLYGRQGLTKYQEIVVNGGVRVHEAWSSESWNGGTYGHALFLLLPESLFLDIADKRDEYQKRIKEDLNKVHAVQNEFIEAVFFEMALGEAQDWRAESGVLIAARRSVPTLAQSRIWSTGFRVFLSHKAEEQKRAGELSDQLRAYGCTAFVAHTSIHPTKEWQDEIENALSTMDAFVALMTPNFHDSLWTDQEVGYALGRSVPVICVKLGMDPYGFIGKFQALKCDWHACAFELVKLLVKQPRMVDSFIAAVRECPSFDRGNDLAKVLPAIDKLSANQASALRDAYATNGKVRASFGFNGTKPHYYGPGLATHLHRLTGRPHHISEEGKLEFLP